jgi:hypothetical protein
MKEQLILLETAKLAKEKGFNPRELHLNNILYDANVAYCNQSLLQKWLREVHNIDVSISAALGEGYYFTLYLNKECIDDSEIKYDTYEEALEVSLKEGLKLLKT